MGLPLTVISGFYKNFRFEDLYRSRVSHLRLFCYFRAESWHLRFFNDKVLHFIYPTLAAEKSQSNLELKQCRSQDQTILFGHLRARKPLLPFSGASEKSMRNQ